MSSGALLHFPSLFSKGNTNGEAQQIHHLRRVAKISQKVGKRQWKILGRRVALESQDRTIKIY